MQSESLIHNSCSLLKELSIAVMHAGSRCYYVKSRRVHRKKKEFYNKEDMENIKVVEATTESGFKRNSFIYDFMSSMRQKINDPLGQRAKKRKEISQR